MEVFLLFSPLCVSFSPSLAPHTHTHTRAPAHSCGDLYSLLLKLIAYMVPLYNCVLFLTVYYFVLTFKLII